MLPQQCWHSIWPPHAWPVLYGHLGSEPMEGNLQSLSPSLFYLCNTAFKINKSFKIIIRERELGFSQELCQLMELKDKRECTPKIFWSVLMMQCLVFWFGAVFIQHLCHFRLSRSERPRSNFSKLVSPVYIKILKVLISSLGVLAISNYFFSLLPLLICVLSDLTVIFM